VLQSAIKQSVGEYGTRGPTPRVEDAPAAVSRLQAEVWVVVGAVECHTCVEQARNEAAAFFSEDTNSLTIV
jgi:hypothetical protein